MPLPALTIASVQFSALVIMPGYVPFVATVSLMVSEAPWLVLVLVIVAALPLPARSATVITLPFKSRVLLL